ncbi:MAG TPA: UDP-2,3-diacylglucosamine diphosphatase LpxI [Methylomirabilota bacterium]|nr:UDP-2,3-diacylglucosamine diphosphatase LpxI [Methylomirabilota bacterium]
MSAEPLGIIAGSKELPLTIARQVAAMDQRPVVAVGFVGETDPAIEGLVARVSWVRVGQLGKLISHLREQGVKECVMAGQVAPKNLFDIRPDLRAMGVLLRLKRKNAHTIFGAIADELQKDGITLIDALRWLEPLMPDKGFVLGPKLSETEMEDVTFGFELAKEVARLEIGQTVVVKEGTVMAVEGFEGTDECLKRGGELAGKGKNAIAVKVAKPGHDMRFDIPCIGAQTIRTCAGAGLRAIALEAKKTLLLERAELEALCRKEKVSVVAV